jgi:Tfp pilus assembly protein PilV
LVNKNGFTLVETIIGVAILAFVIITILGAFSQIQLNTKYVNDKNLALVFAESKMEEILKYPGSELTATSTADIDYAYKSSNSLSLPTSTDPDKADQFRRTLNITEAGNLKNVQVTVEYGKKGSIYPFRVSLNSQRGG